jgi:hypothetical protein
MGLVRDAARALADASCCEVGGRGHLRRRRSTSRGAPAGTVARARRVPEPRTGASGAVGPLWRADLDQSQDDLLAELADLRNRVGCRRHDLDEVDAELGVLLHAGQEGVGWPEAVFRPGQPLSAWPWRTCSAKWYEWPKRSVRRRPDRTTGGTRATTGGRYRRMRDARDGGRLRASATSISTSHISVSHERGRVARARKRLRGPTVVADPPEGLLGPRD